MVQAITADISLPEDVLEFCSAHNLLPSLQSAMSIARESFAPIRRMTVELEVDPETGDETIAVQVGVPLAVEEALSRNRDCTKRWVQTASAEARGKIRLLFDLS